MNKVNGVIQIKPEESEIISMNKEGGGGESAKRLPRECVHAGKTLTWLQRGSPLYQPTNDRADNTPSSSW